MAPKSAGREAVTTTLRPRAKRADSPQFQIACVLLAAGESGLTREAIAEKLDGVSAKKLTGTLWNMKTAGRAERTDGSDTWHLTQAGRDWATGGANLDNQRAAAAEPQLPIGHKKRAGKALRLAASSGTPMVAGAQHLVAVRSFRCWVASDGTFALEKNGQHIELTLEETREMLRYLDCTADELLAHARAA